MTYLFWIVNQLSSLKNFEIKLFKTLKCRFLLNFTGKVLIQGDIWHPCLPTKMLKGTKNAILNLVLDIAKNHLGHSKLIKSYLDWLASHIMGTKNSRFFSFFTNFHCYSYI